MQSCGLREAPFRWRLLAIRLVQKVTSTDVACPKPHLTNNNGAERTPAEPMVGMQTDFQIYRPIGFIAAEISFSNDFAPNQTATVSDCRLEGLRRHRGFKNYAVLFAKEESRYQGMIIPSFDW